jgi:hypothetical protein
MNSSKSLQALPLRAREALNYYFLLLALLFLLAPLSQVISNALELSDFASLFADYNSVLVGRALLPILETLFVAFIIWDHKPFRKVSNGLPSLGFKRVSKKYDTNSGCNWSKYWVNGFAAFFALHLSRGIFMVIRKAHTPYMRKYTHCGYAHLNSRDFFPCI